MHVATDVRAQAVNDVIQGLGAGLVHVDEELVLLCVCARRTRLDVGQVDAFVLQSPDTNSDYLCSSYLPFTGFDGWIDFVLSFAGRNTVRYH